MHVKINYPSENSEVLQYRQQSGYRLSTLAGPRQPANFCLLTADTTPLSSFRSLPTIEICCMVSIPEPINVALSPASLLYRFQSDMLLKWRKRICRGDIHLTATKVRIDTVLNGFNNFLRGRFTRQHAAGVGHTRHGQMGDSRRPLPVGVPIKRA